MNILMLLLAFQTSAGPQEAWTVRVEEPTGLYRRTGEVVQVPLVQLSGHKNGFIVSDAEGREVPSQLSGDALLFPVSVMPGELPEYTVTCCTPRGAVFENRILLRQLGMSRVELGNSRFRVVLDTPSASIIEAYSLTAGPFRILNLVETTPESKGALKEDIHGNTATSLRPVEGVEGENTGWTTLGGKGSFTGIELAETGPLRGLLRLTREGETWELSWTADSPVLRWKARRGFRFAAVSATPYLPFDRFSGGSEYDWPTGPDEGEPPDHAIAPRNWQKLPGGHGVYYARAANYGALGIVALDASLAWQGIGSRRFVAVKEAGETEIALTFPRWSGNNTVLEARRENRVLRQPVLLAVSPSPGKGGAAAAPAAREAQASTQTGASRPTPFRPEILPLDGVWELAWSEKGAGPPASGWRKVQVPGSVHTQWLDPTKIYTREAEWISGKEWWYRRSFSAPENSRGRRLRLQFEATDYYADTYLNGRLVGRHEGYIDPYEYDVTKMVRTDALNEITVRVWTPVGYYWKHRQYTVKGAYGAVDQKPDDITPLGITRSVRLVVSGRAVIRDLAVDTRLRGTGAEVSVSLDSEAADPDAEWEITLSPRNFDSSEVLQLRAPVRASSQRLVLTVPSPRLWWTWDHGRPNLYTLDVRMLDGGGRAVDSRSLAVGIREIETVGWSFYLNRQKLFIRGTNYYYNLFMSDMDRAKYARDVDLMLRMNVNMIRLHCHFSNREFYELADERGVLIWQDFLEAWYPHDTAFSLRAAELYDNHIRYARNHPCVALWATSDEEDLENYRDLTKHLAPRASLLDPQRRPVVRSTGRYGDAHVYHGWYGGSIWEYAKMEEAFVSELGATSLPNYETLIKFMPDQWPIRLHEAEWVWRRLQIPEAMRAWGDPGSLSLKEYIPRTQAYVARLFQLALERQRRRKAEGAGGILHFHAIDIWPSVTMAAIDFERTPTKVFDTVRRSFAPVLASLEYSRDRWRAGETVQCGVWAINDLWEPVSGATVRWKIVDTAGTARADGEWPVSMEPDSAIRLGEAVWTATGPGHYQLRAEVVDRQSKQVSENVFEFEITPP